MPAWNPLEAVAAPASCPLLDAQAVRRYEEALASAGALAVSLRAFLLDRSTDEQAAWMRSTVAAPLFQPWSLEILFAAGVHGALRFNEIQRLLGISPRTLSARLKDLQEAGFLQRTVHDETPVRVNYALSEHGAATAMSTTPLLTHLHRHATMLARQAVAPEAAGTGT